MERKQRVKRRGVGEKLIVRRPSTTKTRDWKVFLSHDENSAQLISLLKHGEVMNLQKKLGSKEILLLSCMQYTQKMKDLNIMR